MDEEISSYSAITVAINASEAESQGQKVFSKADVNNCKMLLKNPYSPRFMPQHKIKNSLSEEISPKRRIKTPMKNALLK